MAAGFETAQAPAPTCSGRAPLLAPGSSFGAIASAGALTVLAAEALVSDGVGRCDWAGAARLTRGPEANERKHTQVGVECSNRMELRRVRTAGNDTQDRDTRGSPSEQVFAVPGSDTWSRAG